MACYLVTGGAGFIGSHLCDVLIKDHSVYVLDDLSTGSIDNIPKGVQLIKGDVCDLPLVEQIMSQVDGCFHLAAIVSIPSCNEDLLRAHQVNLTGVMNVIESSRRVSTASKPIPIVFASSCAVYGDRQQLPHDESAETMPISFYALLKLVAENYGRFASELYNIPFTALRLFNVYGTRQKLDSAYSGVIPIFFNRILHDKPCRFYGDGTSSRDFISVKDVVSFFIKAMQTSKNTMRVYNVCTGKNTEIKTIATLLSEFSNRPLVIDYLPHKAGDILHSRGNPTLSTRELGVTAEQTIEEALKEFVSEIQIES